MTAFAPQVGLLIQNDSGMDIPPRSIVVVTGVETTPPTEFSDPITICHVDQYGCGKPGNVMVTGPATISAGAQGQAFFDQFLCVSIDDTIAPPQIGEEWGPSDDSWVVTRKGKGFFAQGYSADGGVPLRAMFLRTFVRAPASNCTSSSSSTSSSGGSSSGSSSSGSSSTSIPCGCVTVVTDVSCAGGSLSVTYGSARGCC